MIVIIGAPRTGTSMMMQTLKILGVPIVGEKFSDFNLPKNNPNGYYELPISEITDGVNHTKYRGKAVKLFRTGLSKTDIGTIGKVIHCTRNMKHSAKSFLDVLKDTPIGIKPTMNNAKQIIKHNAIYAKVFAEYTKQPIFNVDFENFKKDKINQINELCNFIGIEASDAQKSEAIKNIKDGN